MVNTPDRELRYLELTRILHRYARPGPILEMGSGPGGLGAHTAGFDVIAVDVHTFPTLDAQADGCDLPFRDNTFSTTVCIDVLEHVPPTLRSGLVAELRRVTSDLLVIGGPMGPGSEHADRRLVRWFYRAGRPVPDWLAEHVSTGSYPTVDGINESLGMKPLSCVNGIGLGPHQLISAIGTLRGGTKFGRALSASPRRCAILSRLTRVGTPYRQLLAYDIEPVAFSVIMATRNRAHSLPRAVESVLAQSADSLELIIVNDASDDNTLEVARQLRHGDPRVRVLDVTTPTGSCGLARNAGAHMARGDFLAFCDDDVRWHPEHLARCAKALAHSEACYTQAARFLPDGTFYDVAGRDWQTSEPAIGDVDANTMAIRRSSMLAFPDGRGRYASEDILLAVQLVRRSVQFEFVPEVTVDYTFNPRSHCFRYTFLDDTGQTRVISRPVVKDWRGARGRVVEALSMRLTRLYRSAPIRRHSSQPPDPRPG